MKNFFKKLTGLDKVEAQKAEVESEKMELLKQRDPKDYHTRKKEPWVDVIDVKINEENVRNGFFELDWNEEFVVMLQEAGIRGASDEDVVNKWFNAVCRTVLIQEKADQDYGFEEDNTNERPDVIRKTVNKSKK